MDAIQERVIALDLKNLSQEDLDWLHDLKIEAQAIRTAEFYKSQGMDNVKGERS